MFQSTQEQQQTNITVLEQLLMLVDELKIEMPNLEVDLKASSNAFDALAMAGLTERHNELEDVLTNTEIPSGASLSITTMLLCLDDNSFIRKQEQQVELCETVAKQYLDLLFELLEFFEYHERMSDISANLGFEVNEVAPLTNNPLTDLFVILAAHKFGENLIDNEELDEKHPKLKRARVGSAYFGCYCAWHISKNYPEEARKLLRESFSIGDNIPELEAKGLAIEILEDGLITKKPIH